MGSHRIFEACFKYHVLNNGVPVPVWDEIIPYTSTGEESNAVIEQGAGLLFVTFEKVKQITHSIPTTWVTYKFKDSKGGSCAALDTCDGTGMTDHDLRNRLQGISRTPVRLGSSPDRPDSRDIQAQSDQG